MADESWLDIDPELQHHIYWHKKEQFQLESDQYPHWTLFAVADGKFAYDVGGQQGTAKFPELVLCPPGVEFKRRVIEPVSFHYLCFFFKNRGGQLPDSHQPFPPKLILTDTKRLTNTYSQLRTVENQQGHATRLWADHLLKDIWRQYLFEKMRIPAILSDMGPDSDDPQMAEANRMILEQACVPLSLSAAAASLGLTPVQLTRRYRAAFGISPSEHVTSIRIQRACALLNGTPLNLERIAEECGYENGFYLSRIFSKRMGMSPSAFRKTYRI